MNPNLSQDQHIFLMTSDTIFLNSFDFLGQQNPMGVAATEQSSSASAASSDGPAPPPLATSSASTTATSSASTTATKILNNHFSSLLQANKQWLTVPLPGNYLATNWPPRFAAVNDTGIIYIKIYIIIIYSIILFIRSLLFSLSLLWVLRGQVPCWRWRVRTASAIILSPRGVGSSSAMRRRSETSPSPVAFSGGRQVSHCPDRRTEAE